ncbi:MAG: serine/threonine protein kinase [Polyangiaceae bacterium]|nr:serine/threonine protein kinase [Polyangiaceae bacterium]
MDATELGPGTTLGGDFRIERPLSAGGMGAVFVAVQLSTGKQRALKVMHSSLVADPVMRERFEREARVGAMVPSDHVVEVVGAGVDAALGVPWLAMELLTGENLADHVARRGPLSAAEAAEILRPVCHALGAAHARGVVHRDVKPENVFLARTQSTTHPVVVKMLDFGIARVAADARTASTAAMGTPMWMAPEQTELRSHVTPASDVWALGLIAFWLLTGKPYWQAGAHQGASVAQLMREILFEPIHPASQRAAELGAAVALPPAFDAWFARCLAREPAQRFPTATEAGNALFAEVLGGAPLPSVTPDPSGPSWPSAPPPSASLASATAVPIVTAAAEPRRSSLGLAVGLVVVLMGLFGVAAAAALYLYFRPGADESSRPPIAVASAAEVPSAAPAPSPSALPPTTATAAKRPLPLAAPAPSASAAPKEPPPYNAAVAINAVNVKANWATHACKQMDGIAGYSGTVTFAPAGHVAKMTVNPTIPASGRALCVRSTMSATRVPAFAGTETHDVPYHVSF